MEEVVQLMDLISRENTLSTKPCLLEVLSEEESPNSVWPYSKGQDGTTLTTALPSLSTLVKDKDVPSLEILAPAIMPNLMNIVKEAAEDVPHMVEEVVTAEVILFLKVANTTPLTPITIVRMRTVLIMPLSLNYKASDEIQAVNVSVVPSPPSDKIQLSRDLSASSTLVLEVDQISSLN